MVKANAARKKGRQLETPSKIRQEINPGCAVNYFNIIIMNSA